MTPPSPENLREAVALAEGLVRHALDHDHARGCDGRHYECTCGYDERLWIFARKLREALPALSVPEGWVAVPREVVEPFARAADWEERCIDPDYGIARVRPLKDSRRVAVTLGECRAVRAALSAIPSGGEGSSRPWPIDGAGNLGSAVASGDAGDATAPEHAPDCQSHIVDVRGRPDPCTCGLEPEGGAA